MPTIKPFDSYLIRQDRAQTVVSPAYDSISAEQRRKFLDENPENFINTMRMQEDFPDSAQPSQAQLLNANKECLYALIDDGSFHAIEKPCMFVYQLGTGDQLQTGLVCEVSVDDYESGELKKHEKTRAAKEDLLAEYQEVVGASSSPICLTYPQQADIDNAIGQIMEQKPDLDFVTEGGELQKIWCIQDSDKLRELEHLFNSIDAIYLTDGHHRAASGHRYAEIMRAKSGSNNGDEPYNQLLIALFPDNQLSLLPFHRCARDTNNLSPEQITEALTKDFDVEKLDGHTSFESSKHGEFGMLLDNTWYRLIVKAERVDSQHPVDSLDVSILQDRILDPVLNIKDMRNDPRLGYIAGVSGMEGINQAVTDGWKVIFVCYATSIQQLMNVADAAALMPPKSTYFDPKPRSGIFLRLK